MTSPNSPTSTPGSTTASAQGSTGSVQNPSPIVHEIVQAVVVPTLLAFLSYVSRWVMGRIGQSSASGSTSSPKSGG